MNRRTLELLPPDLAFYASPPHECSYLDDREAATLFVDPYAPVNKAMYSLLAEIGFRRSGPYVYRPRCPGCSACQSARIPAGEFRPNRSQRRTWKASTYPAASKASFHQLAPSMRAERIGSGVARST